MKLTDQEKKEWNFVVMVLRIILGWFLIISSLLFGFCLDGKFLENYEFYIAGDFVVFLFGVWILMKNKVKKKERIREYYDCTPANKTFPKSYRITTFCKKVYFAEINENWFVTWETEGVPYEIKKEFIKLIS